MASEAKFTRREIAAAFSTSAVVLAQTPAAPALQDSQDALATARERIRQNSEQLAAFPLPMATEPAAHFKA